MGLAVGVEKAFGFLSTMLAARLGGPQTFGAYAVTLATAGTVAAYAGAGIGTTANRFSGEYPRDSAGYRSFLRVIVIVAILSASLAAALMLVTASPLARWMTHNESLVGVLRLAAFSSASVVLVECCRGLLIGQQRFSLLLVVAVCLGLGLTILLPLAARAGAAAMVTAQASVGLFTVAVCACFLWRSDLRPSRSVERASGPTLRPVLMFGMIQFGALAGISIASWYVASLVARSDPSLAHMGIYAVANQFRGLASIGPGLFALVGYSLLADEKGRTYGGASRVMLTNTFLTTSVVAIIALPAIEFAPWLVSIAYGPAYAASEVPIVILLATAMIHMGGAPAAQRLSIANLRATAIINFMWSVLIVVLATVLVPRSGVTGAALAFFLAHAFSYWIVILALARAGELPPGYLPMAVVTMISATSLPAFAYFRSIVPSQRLSITAGMLLLAPTLLLLLMRVAVRADCAPQILKMQFKREPVSSTV